MIYVCIVLIETYITFKIMNLITSLVFTVVWYGFTDSRSLSTYRYSAIVRDTVTLFCPEKSQKSVIWYGPPDYMPYSENERINPVLISKKVVTSGNHTTGEYNLEIRNVSYSNQGNYRCRLLKSRPVEYDMLLVIDDQSHPVKETTDYFESNEKHTKTISTEHAIQNTITQNGYNFSNFSEIVRHNDCTNSNDNKFHFIVVCIASIVIIVVTVSCIGILTSIYYKNKYKKRNVQVVEITHDYEEIESANGDLILGETVIDEQIVEASNTVIGIVESITLTSDTNIEDKNELNLEKCLIQESKENNLLATFCQSETDLITVYENHRNDIEDQDAYIHPYETLGPEDYLDPYQPLQLR
ncbi:uncharacterized protein LOC143059169 [Mytilus galloprovincialis]|uniref:uncharacterized protein LOC143059169 n=1 Tax=Mytilus galloprovincialis TaxID=29158 RepID=UPI003F7CB8DD